MYCRFRRAGSAIAYDVREMQVRFYATLRQAVGAKAVDLALPPGATALTLLREAGARYPDLDKLIWDERGNLGEYVRVFVDGREIRYLQGVDTPLPQGAEVDIFPPSAGG